MTKHFEAFLSKYFVKGEVRQASFFFGICYFRGFLTRLACLQLATDKTVFSVRWELCHTLTGFSSRVFRWVFWTYILYFCWTMYPYWYATLNGVCIGFIHELFRCTTCLWSLVSDFSCKKLVMNKWFVNKHLMLFCLYSVMCPPFILCHTIGKTKRSFCFTYRTTIPNTLNEQRLLQLFAKWIK